MKTETIQTYTCEICGTPYQDQKAAELCEAAGIPSVKGKFLKKFLLTPTQVLVNVETASTSTVESRVKWNIVRIDSEELKPLAPTMVRNTLVNIQKFGHRITFKGLYFYPNSYVYESLLSKAIEIPEVLASEALLEYINIHSKRDTMSRESFNDYVVKDCAKLIATTATKMGLALNDSDFDNYSLEGLTNASN